MAGQVRACYECVTRSLEFFKLGWPDVTHLLIFATDVDAYLEHEREIAPEFVQGNPPPSTLIEVPRLVDRDWWVEIQADAISRD
jgi:enamine deaminase RidA (YjgF/YER057c/UK114 family)